MVQGRYGEGRNLEYSENKTKTTGVCTRSAILSAVLRHILVVGVAVVCGCHRSGFEATATRVGYGDANSSGDWHHQADASARPHDGQSNMGDGDSFDWGDGSGDTLSPGDPSRGDAGLPELGNVIFVTSTTHDGNLGGLSGADDICAGLAGGAGLPGNFVAYLSALGAGDTPINAADRLGSAQGWVRRDGRVVALSQANLTSGKLFYPPLLNEWGQETVMGADVPTFTGSSFGGTMAIDRHCHSWTTNAPANAATIGNGAAGSSHWQAATQADCDNELSIYCLQIDHQDALEPPTPVAGRRIFVSASPSTGETPDETCARSATSAGLAGTFRALVAWSNATAVERFNLDWWPWIRMDGLPVFASSDELQANRPQFAIAFKADGLEIGTPFVYTGAADLFSLAVNNCSDWTVTNGDPVVAGKSYTTTHQWFSDLGDGGYVNTCGYGGHEYYCLEE